MEKRFIDWMKKEGKSKAFIAMYKKTPVGFGEKLSKMIEVLTYQAMGVEGVNCGYNLSDDELRRHAEAFSKIFTKYKEFHNG